MAIPRFAEPSQVDILRRIGSDSCQCMNIGLKVNMKCSTSPKVSQVVTDQNTNLIAGNSDGVWCYDHEEELRRCSEIGSHPPW
jgi:hypothetical protein